MRQREHDIDRERERLGWKEGEGERRDGERKAQGRMVGRERGGERDKRE